MIAGLPERTTLQDALQRARSHAPFLAMAMQVQPELTDLLAAENLLWTIAAGQGKVRTMSGRNCARKNARWR